MRMMFVAGTRPEAVKLSPILWNLRRDEYIWVWSGQHYDYEMSKIFFQQLELPEPDVDLGIRSKGHAKQTAEIMVGLEKVISEYKPEMVVALGDTNTVVATVLTAAKLQIPSAHVEAGMRSWDRTMPEEINRIIADHTSEILFAFTRLAQIYLVHEGIPLNKIFVSGCTEVDVIHRYRNLIDKQGKRLIQQYNLESNGYVLVTIHRQSNVDNRETLGNIISALNEIARDYKVLFPVHPRTQKAIATYGFENKLKVRNMLLLRPLGFFEFLGLLKYTKVVLTDSGGVQADTCTLNIPTVVLRYNTEYPECIILGISKLAGTRKQDILHAFREITQSKNEGTLRYVNPLGDGKAGKRIAMILRTARAKMDSTDLRHLPLVVYNLVTDIEARDEVLTWYDRAGRPLSQDAHYYLVKRRYGSEYSKKLLKHFLF